MNNEILINGKEIIGKVIHRKEVGKKIYEDFINKVYDEEKGVCLSYNIQRVGIISNCMALSIILMADWFDLDNIKYEKVVLNLFKKIYNEITTKSYNASPYFENDENIKMLSYVETISKVLITLIDLRCYVLKNGFSKYENFELNDTKVNSDEAFVELLEKMIIKAIEKLNDACLPCDEIKPYIINGHKTKRPFTDENITHKGWTFENIGEKASEYGVSIYYTFHASTAFLNLYRAFDVQFQKEFFKNDISSNELDEKKIELNKKNFIFFNKYLAQISDFRDRVISAGRYFETKIYENNVNLANDYVNKDLKPVKFDSIIESQKSNDVMNTLFVLGILINAGVDDEYFYENLDKNNEEDNTFYEQIQFGINNVKKIYLLLKKNNREDIIDSYKLLFDENSPNDKKATIQEFRKKCADVSTYDFVPLFCNVYSTISQYLIKFPQKEMQDLLVLILDNRAPNSWIWTKDGFDINNMTYYISALIAYYDYYDEYEKPLSEWGEKYNDKVKKAENNLETSRQQILDLNQKIENLKTQLENKENPLQNEVEKIAEKICKNTIETSIEKYFSEMVNETRDLYIDLIQQNKKNGLIDINENELNEKYKKANLLLQISNAENYAGHLKASKDSVVEAMKRDFNNSLMRRICKDVKSSIENIFKI